MIEEVRGERMELLERRKIQYDGVHRRFNLEQLSPRAMLLKISGTDVCEFRFRRSNRPRKGSGFHV